MYILGIMSGSSLDGLDLALCSFDKKGKTLAWKILAAETIPYPELWDHRLRAAHGLSGMDLLYLHRDYGEYIALEALNFLSSNDLKADLIASHGHTVFHQPESAFTFQIGDPQVIATRTKTMTIGDFRKLDVSLGGQGAPLVPAGDEYLFGQYDYCLNLGGIANISCRENGRRVARDVCPVNLILNHFAQELGMTFDRDGKAGQSGKICSPLLEKLNGLTYYQAGGPASISREWVESEFMPCIEEFSIPVTDTLRTVCEHIAQQISSVIAPDSVVLVTGGGAYNRFLIKRIRETSKARIIIPENRIIDFKEALIFAFLGMLRKQNEINCFASVTGAARDSCSGVIFNPF